MLDDLARIGKLDANDMLSRMESLPEQLIESRNLVKEVVVQTKPRSLVVTGMGGSGIVGDLIHDWLSGSIDIPIFTNKNLALSISLDRESLLVAVSYSGNTRETILALSEGMKMTDNVLCIASGGRLMEICRENSHGFVKVPPGYPPRSALGYLFGSLAHSLKKADVHDCEKELTDAISRLKGARESLVPRDPFLREEMADGA
jgi:glucose/mannose-6-phosphate isomerase